MMLQLLSGMQKIDNKCFQGYKPAKKEDKNFGKNEYTNIFFANALSKKQQSFIYSTNKKNQYNQRGFWRNSGQR